MRSSTTTLARRGQLACVDVAPEPNAPRDEIAASRREPEGLSAEEAGRVSYALAVHAALEREYALLAA